MNWTTENEKDAAMLQRLDLGLLDVALAGGDEAAVGEIGVNNAKLLELTDRFAKLAEDRKRLADFKNWLDAAAEGITAFRSKVERETWDLLLALRNFLLERQALLVRLEAAADARLATVQGQHDSIRDRLCKSLEKERRKMLAANPATGNWHFADLVDGNEDVEAATKECLAAKANFDAVLSARRKADDNLATVKVRQRDAFPVIAA